jgi:dienelactone hydrolase
LVVAPVPVQSGDGPPPIVKGTFPSGGKPIRVEQFEPDGKGKCQAVVLLYGVDGLHAGNETAFRAAARQVADKGFVVLLLHYHDRTSTSLKEAPALLGQLRDFLQDPDKSGKEPREMRELFAARCRR